MEAGWVLQRWVKFHDSKGLNAVHFDLKPWQLKKVRCITGAKKVLLFVVGLQAIKDLKGSADNHRSSKINASLSDSGRKPINSCVSMDLHLHLTIFLTFISQYTYYHTHFFIFLTNLTHLSHHYLPSPNPPFIPPLVYFFIPLCTWSPMHTSSPFIHYTPHHTHILTTYLIPHHSFPILPRACSLCTWPPSILPKPSHEIHFPPKPNPMPISSYTIHTHLSCLLCLLLSLASSPFPPINFLSNPNTGDPCVHGHPNFFRSPPPKPFLCQTRISSQSSLYPPFSILHAHQTHHRTPHFHLIFDTTSSISPERGIYPREEGSLYIVLL